MKNTKCIQRISLGIMVILLVSFASIVSAATMKIAVPATSPEIDSLISQETGRAPFFLFFDNKGNFLEAVKNPAVEQSGGISRTVVALLVGNDITIIITDSIGDKMKKSLTDHHIDITNGTGTVHDAVKSLIQK